MHASGFYFPQLFDGFLSIYKINKPICPRRLAIKVKYVIFNPLIKPELLKEELIRSFCCHRLL